VKRQVEDTHIYFPIKVLNAMRKLAARNRRSVSAEMVIAAERHIETEQPATNETKGKGAK
jgi:hypothetical protein